MRKLFLIFATILASLVMSGCSSSTEFVVINNSTSVMNIEFVTTSNFDSIEHTALKPYKTSVSEWGKWIGRTEWQEVLQNEYEFDSQTHTAKIKLNPNEILRIVIALHHEENMPKEYYENFPIKTLRLDGENGEIIYSGKQFSKQFNKKDDHNYFIEYK